MSARPYIRGWLLIVLLIAPLFATGMIGSLAQEPTFSIKVDAPLVTVDTHVVDALGKPVTNLTQEDFKIYEDGEEQSIQSFAPAASSWSVLVLFEASGYPSGPNQNLTGGDNATVPAGLGVQGLEVWAINHFLTVLRAQDRIAVAQYSWRDSHSVVVPWQQIHPGRQSFTVPNGTRPGGNEGFESQVGKDFYGALAWTAQQFRGIEGRKAVVVFSSGTDRTVNPTIMMDNHAHDQILDPLFGLPDSVEQSAFQDALTSMRQSGVPFYFVALDPQFIFEFMKGSATPSGISDLVLFSMVNTHTTNLKRAADMSDRIHIRLQQAADASGGRVYHPQTMEEVRTHAEQISKDLTTYFSISYHPPKHPGDGKSHRIDVRVRDKSFRVVQSREVYAAN